ncbi:MAG: hypothetical protein ABL895_13935 [Cyclobacteriaceae bacterium]
MESKFKAGEIVYERIRPTLKLIVANCINNLYYCKLHEFPKRKELVYFERELARPHQIKNN